MKFQCYNSNASQSSDTVEFCINRESESLSIQKKQLADFTSLCWDTYSSRLNETSDKLFKAGESEYKISNPLIINKILSIDIPLNLSLSVTRDGSLHYTFRFRENMTLFVATHLYLEEENHTYIEFFKDDDLKISGHYPLDVGLELFKERFNEVKGRDYIDYLPSDTLKLDTFKIDCD